MVKRATLRPSWFLPTGVRVLLSPFYAIADSICEDSNVSVTPSCLFSGVERFALSKPKIKISLRNVNREQSPPLPIKRIRRLVHYKKENRLSKD